MDCGCVSNGSMQGLHDAQQDLNDIEEILNIVIVAEGKVIGFVKSLLPLIFVFSIFVVIWYRMPNAVD